MYIKKDEKMSNLVISKNNYLNKIDNRQLTPGENKKYKKFLKEYDSYKKFYNQKIIRI